MIYLIGSMESIMMQYESINHHKADDRGLIEHIEHWPSLTPPILG